MCRTPVCVCVSHTATLSGCATRQEARSRGPDPGAADLLRPPKPDGCPGGKGPAASRADTLLLGERRAGSHSSHSAPTTWKQRATGGAGDRCCTCRRCWLLAAPYPGPRTSCKLAAAALSFPPRGSAREAPHPNCALRTACPKAPCSGSMSARTGLRHQGSRAPMYASPRRHWLLVVNAGNACACDLGLRLDHHTFRFRRRAPPLCTSMASVASVTPCMSGRRPAGLGVLWAGAGPNLSSQRQQLRGRHVCFMGVRTCCATLCTPAECAWEEITDSWCWPGSDRCSEGVRGQVLWYRTPGAWCSGIVPHTSNCIDQLHTVACYITN